jgi:hypothetical protein
MALKPEAVLNSLHAFLQTEGIAGQLVAAKSPKDRTRLLLAAAGQDQEGRDIPIVIEVVSAQEGAAAAAAIMGGAAGDAADTENDFFLLFTAVLPFTLDFSDQRKLPHLMELLRVITTLNASLEFPGFTVSEGGEHVLFRYAWAGDTQSYRDALAFRILSLVVFHSENFGAPMEALAKGEITLADIAKQADEFRQELPKK